MARHLQWHRRPFKSHQVEGLGRRVVLSMASTDACVQSRKTIAGSINASPALPRRGVISTFKEPSTRLRTLRCDAHEHTGITHQSVLSPDSFSFVYSVSPLPPRASVKIAVGGRDVNDGTPALVAAERSSARNAAFSLRSADTAFMSCKPTSRSGKYDGNFNAPVTHVRSFGRLRTIFCAIYTGALMRVVVTASLRVVRN